VDPMPRAALGKRRTETLEQLDILKEITIWHWFGAGALLLVLEMLVPGVIFMWLGIAAGITGFVLLAFPTMSWEVQFFVFAGFSIVAVFAGRAWVKSNPTKSDQPNLNIRGAQYVGRSFTLTEPIENGFGIIVVDDTRWKISGPDLPAGSKINVTSQDNQMFMVEAVKD
jgi:inner membrane protein